MNLTTFDQIRQIGQDAVAVDAASLYKAFEQVKDMRKRKGKRYPLALILTLVMLGKMAGQTTIAGTIHWINLRKKQIQQLLNWPREFPSHWAYINAFAHCDDQELVQVLAQVILKARAVEQCGPEPSRLLAQKEQGEENLLYTAIDGKVMRGTLKHGRDDRPPVHLLSLYECVVGIVLAHVSVKKRKTR